MTTRIFVHQDSESSLRKYLDCRACTATSLERRLRIFFDPFRILIHSGGGLSCLAAYSNCLHTRLRLPRAGPLSRILPRDSLHPQQHHIMDPAEIALAIRNGTLDYKGCMAQFYERKHNFANDAELLPDIRQRGVTIFDDAIGFGVLTAIGEEKPIVSVLQEVLNKIGALYVENQQRLEQAASDAASAAANEPDDLLEQIADNETGSEESGILHSDEESDDPDDAADSGSDYERKGHKRIGKGKRSPGRPKTKDFEEKKVKEAVLARQKRKRLSHWSPEKLGRDPKRRLYESLGESSEIGERASASPSSLAAATRRLKEDDATSPSPPSALAKNGKGKHQKVRRFVPSTH